MSSGRKRERGLPTGSTPHLPFKSRSLSRTAGKTVEVPRFQLSFATPRERSGLRLPGTWTRDEEIAVVEFILMTQPENACWPRTINEKYWDAAADFISQRCGKIS